MGNKPVQVELLSDPNEGKADSFSCVDSPVFDALLMYPGA